MYYLTLFQYTPPSDRPKTHYLQQISSGLASKNLVVRPIFSKSVLEPWQLNKIRYLTCIRQVLLRIIP